MGTTLGQDVEMRAGETRTLRFAITDVDGTMDPNTVTFTYTAGEGAIVKPGLREGATMVWAVRLDPVDTQGWGGRRVPHQLVAVDGAGATEVVAEGALIIHDTLND